MSEVSRELQQLFLLLVLVVELDFPLKVLLLPLILQIAEWAPQSGVVVTATGFFCSEDINNSGHLEDNCFEVGAVDIIIIIMLFKHDPILLSLSLQSPPESGPANTLLNRGASIAPLGFCLKYYTPTNLKIHILNFPYMLHQ